MPDQRLAKLRKKAMQLPLLPGVYIMKDASGKIIYIGKAKALKNRVSQYFGSQAHHTEKVRQMVANVDDFDYIQVSSEFEALTLECSLIKQHSPKYNILLKDDKGFHYIRVTPPPWASIRAVKQTADDGAEYIGPYNSFYVVRESVEAACKAFGLATCAKRPSEMGRRGTRPCLNYFIGQCSAPCAGKIGRDEYDQSVAEAVQFLKNGSREVLEDLTRRMNEASERLEFERAARLRDRIAALNKVAERQTVVRTKVADQDVIALAMSHDSACFEVLTFRGGRLCDREHFITSAVDDAAEARAEFITRYYSLGREVPPTVALDGECDDCQLLTQWLTDKRGRAVHITLPQRGEQAQIVKLCSDNAFLHLSEGTGRSGAQTAALDELAQLIGLRRPPKYIEAYDISHTAGSENVAGMVVFKDGAPFKSAYRKFKINSFTGQDDYASMAEVLARRLADYQLGKEGFDRLPDLILLDGGAGQLSAVMPVVASCNVDVPVFGMVKDDRHRTRALVGTDGEIAIKATRRVFTLITAIQDEVHRFAIGYHRARRSKAMLHSSLTDIDGIGPKRAQAVLTHFGTLAAVKAADLDSLMAVEGMTRPAAESIYRHYHKEERYGDA